MPAIYGISFTSCYASICYKTINILKKLYPDIVIICGGPHPTVLANEVLAKSQADVCCKGEGEETIIEIIRNVRNNVDFSHIRGITYRDRNGAITENPARPLTKNLDTILFPAWDFIDFEDCREIRRSRGRLASYVLASRGCPYLCSFCSNPVWKFQKPWLRKRSPENIVREVQMLYGIRVRDIYLLSDQMNSDLEWAAAVFKALSDLGYSDLFFQCNLRAKPFTHNLAKLMKKANCWEVHIGLESVNTRVLYGIKKGILLKDAIETLKILKSYKIKIFIFMMMYQVWKDDEGQLQTESTREVFKSLIYIISLRLKGLVNNISWGFAVPLPGSEMYNILKEQNLLDETPDYRNKLWIHEIPTWLTNISKFEMIIARALGLMLQGILVICSKEYYTCGNIRTNSVRAVKKLFYIFRPW